MQEFDRAERDKPWGTVDALCAASDIIQEPFIVCNGDDLYGTTTFAILIDFLKNKYGTGTLVAAAVSRAITQSLSLPVCANESSSNFGADLDVATKFLNK